MTDETLYIGREQTQVKHFILQKYLERFARIVGTFADSITYVDCFSGPWNVRSPELKDSSFSIALQELRKAQTTLAGRGHALRLRCMFLEKDPGPYARLAEFAAQVHDAEIKTTNGELTGNIEGILRFVTEGGPRTFPFIFIDPTGWKGFEMNLIAPLLRLRPGEVLINFMTDHIRRFFDTPHQQTKEQFTALFGSAEVKSRIQGLEDKQDREDALIRAYSENVRATGHFAYICTAIVLYPGKDRPFFHLIYATRNRKGVEVFKKVEEQATEVMQKSRGKAKQRKREQKTGQAGFLPPEDMPQSMPIEHLRNRYLRCAKQRVLDVLIAKPRLPYEEAWDAALAFPLVWENDLKDWIKHWKADHRLRVDGMQPSQRVPKLDENNVLVWLAGPSLGPYGNR